MTGWYDRHPVVAGVCVFLVLLLFADVVVGRIRSGKERELGARAAAVERTYRVESERYHHDLLPGVSVDSAPWGDGTYALRTNSLGFKDATTRVVDSTDARPRVLFLGDSFTEGIGVPFDSTFVGRVAVVAAANGVEVLNGAVASYSPIIYWKKAVDLIERRKVRIDEVVVFIDISDVMDESMYFLDDSGSVRSRRPAGRVVDRLLERWRKNSFLLYRAARSGLRRAERTSPAEPACRAADGYEEEQCRAGWTRSQSIMARYGTVGLAQARKHMTLLAGFLGSRSIPLTIVVYPWRLQLRGNDRSSLQSSTWREWAAANGAGFVDLFEASFAAADSSSVESLIARDFIPGDLHWSVGGHAFVATHFSRAYCAQPGAREDKGRRPPLAAAVCR